MSFDLHRPNTMAEAIGLAARLGPAARYIAGGTDLVVQINRGRATPQHVIDISHLADLRHDIVQTADGFSLGALTRYRSIERHPAFQDALKLLPEAASVVGGVQVRNIASIGGNIVNASPAADFVPALLALDAELDIQGAAGRRSESLRDFILGPGKTGLQAGEILAAVRFKPLPAHSATAFLKEGRRKAMEISVVCVAASLTLDASGKTCLAARIAVGAVAPKAYRAAAAEAALAGLPADTASFRLAGQLAAEQAAPISDVRASAEHRHHLVSVLVQRALETCRQRIAGA